MPFDDAFLAVDCDPGEIADVLVRTCYLVEKSGLAAVLLPGKCEGQFGAFGELVLVFFGMEFAAFTESRVRVVLMQGVNVRCVVNIGPVAVVFLDVTWHNGNLFRIG